MVLMFMGLRSSKPRSYPALQASFYPTSNADSANAILSLGSGAVSRPHRSPCSVKCFHVRLFQAPEKLVSTMGFGLRPSR